LREGPGVRLKTNFKTFLKVLTFLPESLSERKKRHSRKKEDSFGK
jgi:hypothetical protein